MASSLSDATWRRAHRQTTRFLHPIPRDGFPHWLLVDRFFDPTPASVNAASRGATLSPITGM